MSTVKTYDKLYISGIWQEGHSQHTLTNTNPLSDFVYFTGSTGVARQIHTGMSHVNSPSVQDEAHVMFGGMKQSGLGRTNGEWVIEKFTEERWISVNR